MKMTCALLVSAMLVALAACSNGSQNSESANSEMEKQSAVLEANAGSVIGAWIRQGPSDGVVRVEGDTALSGSVSFFWPLTDTQAHTLKVKLAATGAGQLQVQSYYMGGKPSVLGQAYANGTNDLTFELPAAIDGSRVTIVRGDGSAAAVLESATLLRVKQ